MEFPYKVGTLLEIDDNNLVTVCGYKITFENDTPIIKVLLNSTNGDLEINITDLETRLKRVISIPDEAYLPSNDSEVIANILDGFIYDPNKTDEILSKYERLLNEQRVQTKRLIP